MSVLTQIYSLLHTQIHENAPECVVHRCIKSVNYFCICCTQTHLNSRLKKRTILVLRIHKILHQMPYIYKCQRHISPCCFVQHQHNPIWAFVNVVSGRKKYLASTTIRIDFVTTDRPVSTNAKQIATGQKKDTSFLILFHTPSILFINVDSRVPWWLKICTETNYV